MLTDANRRELYGLLETGIGPRGAELMMDYLPPVGWADVATRRDLDTMRAELRGEIAELRGEVRAMLPKLIVANIASSITVAGLVLAASHL